MNGLRAKDIADLLEISPKTVDTCRTSLMRKLNAHDVVGLVKLAIERNLSASGSGRELASQPVLLFWYRSNAPISWSTADLCSCRRARARRRTRQLWSRTRGCFVAAESIRSFLRSNVPGGRGHTREELVFHAAIYGRLI